MKTVRLWLALALGSLSTLTFAYNAYDDLPPPCNHPGGCYLYYELIDCPKDDFTCRDGTRRIWSYRPLYYPIDHTILIENLNREVIQVDGRPFWPYTTQQTYEYYKFQGY